ncbi:type IV pilus secretin PilQ/predicted competence protein [Variovorax ginsengisoli]|uniref:Type IV pilus biogenesis and competence protein PilQ n=1 Tax=Variovorax ginsengisoli TaxID=363844 RepID=A0ABT9S5A3_9BURK|nr:type IV pilus secretin PilQ/predicted competence protein [Variovorax ginsengisoli]
MAVKALVGLALASAFAWNAAAANRSVASSVPSATAVPYQGDLLSLDFQSIEIREVLKVIADFTQINIVTSDAVSGALTLRLKDVPWDQALDIILQAKRLGMRRDGNVMWIATQEELRAREKQDFEALAAIEHLEPLRTQSFQLNYAKAAVIAQGLTGAGIGAWAGGPVSNSGRPGQRDAGGDGIGGGRAEGMASTARLLSARGSVIAELRTNQLFVTDIAARLAQVADLVRQLDIPVRQVLIEARIVEAADSFGKSLGVKFGGGAVDARSAIGNPAPSAAGGPASFGQNNFVNLPSLGVGGNTAGSLALSLFDASLTRMLNLEISALEAEGKGQVVSSPRVVTADQTRALIEQGTELPYQVATASGATSIAFRKANLKLEVTPQITPEGRIILSLDVNKDSVGQATTAGFAINTKHIQTEVLVDNGGTVVIGGIFEITENNDESRVPVLGEVPYLGALFRTRNRSYNKTEMLVFITPKMITERYAAP